MIAEDIGNVFIGFACFALIGFIVGLLYGFNTTRTDAINAGVAYYCVDSTTGDVEFMWKEVE